MGFLHVSKFCPECGFANDDDAKTCTFCRTSLVLTDSNSQDAGAHDKTYLQGIMDLRNYTILGFISLIVGIAVNYVTLKTFSYDYLVGPLGTAFGGASLNTADLSTALVYSELALAASSILSIIGFYLLFRGFGILKALSLDFSVGRTGATLEISGMGLLLLGVIGLLAILLPVINLGNSSAATTLAQSELGSILGIVILLFIALLLLLVGVIMVLIGIYRVGVRFDSSLVQVGAVLTFFLGIIGTILLFIGFTKIINVLRHNEGGTESIG